MKAATMNERARMKTHTQTVHGNDRARHCAERLAADSQWFAFMPLPDDDYDISVRPENAERLARLADVQIYNPLGFTCAPNQSTPDYIAYDDFRQWLAYGLIVCWLSHDRNDPDADCAMGRPVTRDDVQEMRRVFLDLVETVTAAIWRGDYGPGDGEIDGDYQHVYIGPDGDDSGSDLCVLTWRPRLDADSIMMEMECSGGDSTVIWLNYAGIEDRAHVAAVLTEARRATATGEIWDKLAALVG